MKKNVGGLDKMLRIGVGALFVLLALTGVIGWWGWLGIIPLATGLTSYCALYQLLGMNTCPVNKK